MSRRPSFRRRVCNLAVAVVAVWSVVLVQSASSAFASADGVSAGPITTFTSPAENKKVSGTINVAATAQDQSGIGMWFTVFRVDSPNADPIAIDYSSPWGFSLDTTTLTDGKHTLYVRGVDNTFGIGLDATLTLKVKNK
jgi:Bacterial Ig domain